MEPTGQNEEDNRVGDQAHVGDPAFLSQEPDGTGQRLGGLVPGHQVKLVQGTDVVQPPAGIQPAHGQDRLQDFGTGRNPEAIQIASLLQGIQVQRRARSGRGGAQKGLKHLVGPHPRAGAVQAGENAAQRLLVGRIHDVGRDRVVQQTLLNLLNRGDHFVGGRILSNPTPQSLEVPQDGQRDVQPHPIGGWRTREELTVLGIEAHRPALVPGMVEFQHGRRQSRGPLLSVYDPPSIGGLGCGKRRPSDDDRLGVGPSLPEEERPDRIAPPDAVEKLHDILGRPAQGALKAGDPNLAALHLLQQVAHGDGGGGRSTGQRAEERGHDGGMFLVGPSPILWRCARAAAGGSLRAGGDGGWHLRPADSITAGRTRGAIPSPGQLPFASRDTSRTNARTCLVPERSAACFSKKDLAASRSFPACRRRESSPRSQPPNHPTR